MLDPFAPAWTLAELTSTRAVRSRDLVELYLDRIARYDHELHALVTVDAEGARAQADRLDRQAAEGQPCGPLHGVPVTIKDCWATAGLRTAAGSPETVTVPSADATVVARYRRAGAVILGKTSVPPGISGQETASPLSGVTANPWDLARTSGASSGGAASALAAGLTALEVGSDLGGSLRQPAHCCGVFAHLASHGLVPLRGHLPHIPTDVDLRVDLLGAGPMARSAADLALAFSVLAGPEVMQGRAWKAALPASPPREALRIAAWLDDPAAPVDPAVGEVLEQAVAALERAGVRVEREARPFDSLEEAKATDFALWVAASSYSDDDETQRRLAEVVRRGDPADRSLVMQRARAATMSHRDWLHLDEQRQRVQAQWERFFTDYDVLLCPIIGITAPEHDPQPDRVASLDHRLARTIEVAGQTRPYLDQVVWTTLVTAPGLPATAIPVGRARDGLPVGVQAVGAYGRDLTTLAMAQWLSELVPGPERPPRYP